MLLSLLKCYFCEELKVYQYIYHELVVADPEAAVVTVEEVVGINITTATTNGHITNSSARIKNYCCHK